MTKAQCKNDCKFRNNNLFLFGPDMPDFDSRDFGEACFLDQYTDLSCFSSALSLFYEECRRSSRDADSISSSSSGVSLSQWNEDFRRKISLIRKYGSFKEASKDPEFYGGRFEAFLEDSEFSLRKRSKYSKKMSYGYFCH